MRSQNAQQITIIVYLKSYGQFAKCTYIWRGASLYKIYYSIKFKLPSRPKQGSSIGNKTCTTLVLQDNKQNKTSVMYSDTNCHKPLCSCCKLLYICSHVLLYMFRALIENNMFVTYRCLLVAFFKVIRTTTPSLSSRIFAKKSVSKIVYVTFNFLSS